MDSNTRGGSLLLEGAGCIDACQRFLLACSALPARGNPPFSVFPRRGNGKDSPPFVKSFLGW